MKRIFTAYKDLIGIIFEEAPLIVILTFICTIISGLLTPVSVYINKNVFDTRFVCNRTNVGRVVYLDVLVSVQGNKDDV